jgi:hypothetical protein
MVENCPIEPLAQAESIENPKIFNLNYTNQDFWSMKSRLVDFINERFGSEGTVLPNTFNDLVESSIAIMLIETWSFLADTLSFKMDQIANELFVDTVTEKENIFRLAKLVGFEPTPPIASRTLWTGTLNSVLPNDAILATPYVIDLSDDNGIPLSIELFAADSDNNPLFEEDIILPAGTVVNSSIVGLEGLTFTDFASGNGEISQTISLAESPVIFDSISVFVDGVKWEKVDYFTDSQPRREFLTDFDATYNAFVIFGNNRAGLIPTTGSDIQIVYRVGGGARGNIVTGFVETQAQVPVPGLSVSIPLSLRNYTRGEFGYNGDTTDDVRRKLPAYARTQDRAVTGTDYTTLSEQFVTTAQGQVGIATAVLRNSGCAGNIIDLYILTRSGETVQEASTELKADLSEYLEDKKMFTDHICIKDGLVVEVDISIEAVIPRTFRKFEPELRERVAVIINDFFLLNNWQFNRDLTTNDLIKQLSQIDEVQRYEITLTTNDPDNSGIRVDAKFNELIRPDQTDVAFVFV